MIDNGIHYFSLLDGTGYGDAAAAYIDGMLERGIPVKFTPLVFFRHGLVPITLLPESHLDQLHTGDQRRESLLALMETDIDPAIMLIHCFPELIDKLRKPGLPTICYTVWETNKLPLHWPEHFNHVDHLVVPCEMNRALFSIPEGPPVSVVPHVLKESLLRPVQTDIDALRNNLDIDADTWVYYNISSWSPRKAIWETLHSFLLTFTAEDDVCLVLKTNSTGQDLTSHNQGRYAPVCNMVNEIISAYSNPARVILVDRHLDPTEVEALHHIGDCYYSLTCSEGWGLGAFDAATSGNSIVITGWGGQLDYLPAEAAYLVDYRLVNVKPYARWESYTSDQQWAAADIDHAISLLEHVYHNRTEATARGKLLQSHVIENFSSAQVMKKFCSVLESV